MMKVLHKRAAYHSWVVPFLPHPARMRVVPLLPSSSSRVARWGLVTLVSFARVSPPYAYERFVGAWGVKSQSVCQVSIVVVVVVVVGGASK